MRTFVQKTAGATFYQGESVSVVMRKDYVEYVFKLDGGWYGVVNVMVYGPEEMLLFLNWEQFFKRVTNHNDINKLLLMLKKPCPKVFELLAKGGDYSMVTLPYFDKMGIARHIPLNTDARMVELVGNHVILKAAGDLLAYGLDVYHEINESCPFPGWKKGLVDDL